MSGLIARWAILAPRVTAEGEIEYGRTDLLNYLLNTAHETALANIAECKAREIPCIAPIASFEIAELSRDDRDNDKVDVLANYWAASMQAKALLMLSSKAGLPK